MSKIDEIRTIMQAYERNHDTSNYSAEQYEELEYAAIKSILEYPLNIAYKKLEEYASGHINTEWGYEL